MEKSENYPLTIQNSSRYPSFIFGIKTITTKKLPKRDGLHHFLAKSDEKQQSILSLLSLFNKKYFFWRMWHRVTFYKKKQKEKRDEIHRLN